MIGARRRHDHAWAGGPPFPSMTLRIMVIQHLVIHDGMHHAAWR
jgi:hypothetical protein